SGMEGAVVELAEKVAAGLALRPAQGLGWEASADDARRRVVVDRSTEARVGRRPMFDSRPTVIRARDALVDLFRLPAHVVNEKATRFGLYREGKRVAQAECPDRPIFAGCPGDEGVISRKRAIRVDAEQLPQQRLEVLRRLAGSLVPEGDVQLAILAKVEGAALVAGRNLATEFRLIVAFQQDFLAPRLGRVAHRGEATDDVV